MENTSQHQLLNNYHGDIPKMTSYLVPISKENLISAAPKIEVVLNTFKTKIDQANSLIITNNDEIHFSNLKQTSNLQNIEKQNFILEAQRFLHRSESNETTIKTFDSEYLKSLISLINDKGVIACLMDYHHLLKLPEVIKELTEGQVNFLIKFFILEKLPLIGLVYIQKFENCPCKFENMKLLSYEIYEDNTITKPLSYHVKDLGNSVSYMYEMYQYQGYLSEQRPGLVLKINVKENFWSDNIDFTLTIVDTEEPELKEKKICVAIIVTKAYANDFIYLTKEGNMALCEQVKASRLILIRPNAFNYDSISEIKDKLSHYIIMFKFKSCQNESIPIMQFSDSSNETYEVYNTNRFLIRDIVENEKKETFRQLIFHDAPNEVQSEIKLLLSMKNKAKNDTETYTTLPTIARYKEKNFVSCLDKTFICSFYIKCLLSAAFFLDSEDFPKKNFEFLVLGAGIGSVNHYFDLFFRSKVNITSVEIDKIMPEIGQTYFGFRNLERSNYKWIYGDAKDFLITNKSQKFDMIVSDINNTNPHDGISPPPVFFENHVLETIKVNLYIYFRIHSLILEFM
jgi:hypothetical protein